MSLQWGLWARRVFALGLVLESEGILKLPGVAFLELEVHV